MLRLSILLIVLILQKCWNFQDFFTATSDLETLLKTHRKIVIDINAYILKEENRLNILKRYLHEHSVEQQKSVKDVPEYIGNPINAFKLITRLTTGLHVIEDTIKEGINLSLTMALRDKQMKYPNVEDLKGAVLALTRLKISYSLKIHDLSQGILNGFNSSVTLSSDDCYEIGSVLYYENEFDDAYAWISESHRKYLEIDKRVRKYLPFSETDILRISENTKLQSNQANDEHVEIGNESSENEIRNKNNDKNEKYKNQLIFKNNTMIEKNSNNKIKSKQTSNFFGRKFEKYKNAYVSLCRGETNISSYITKRLKCWFSSEYHPFLKYAPMKVEQIYIQPNIYMFHEVLTDFEIEQLKMMSKPVLWRSMVREPTDDGVGELRPTKLRISKTACLSDEESPILARITQRVSDMTGLHMKFSERLQISNYGIGGYYAPHYDFSRPGGETEKLYPVSIGRRIATVLFYMSDVSQGGATIFMKLGLSIFPTKRAAVFWLNLHPSGELNWATLHAACPVLRGSKWVCTKWIHEGGQELSRPCPLEKHEKQHIRNLR